MMTILSMADLEDALILSLLEFKPREGRQQATHPWAPTLIEEDLGR